jgi:proline-specific peptidase
MCVQEGTISVDGYQVWYRRVGHGGIPLLLLHGGPGAGHDYLEPLEALATDRTVVFYDQLGCGKSDQPDDRSLWRMERFVAEVDTVRRALYLERMHLLGQSWGGWLAIEYLLTHSPRSGQCGTGQHLGQHPPVCGRSRAPEGGAAAGHRSHPAAL